MFTYINQKWRQIGLNIFGMEDISKNKAENLERMSGILVEETYSPNISLVALNFFRSHNNIDYKLSTIALRKENSIIGILDPFNKGKGKNITFFLFIIGSRHLSFETPVILNEENNFSSPGLTLKVDLLLVNMKNILAKKDLIVYISQRKIEITFLNFEKVDISILKALTNFFNDLLETFNKVECYLQNNTNCIDSEYLDSINRILYPKNVYCRPYLLFKYTSSFDSLNYQKNKLNNEIELVYEKLREIKEINFDDLINKLKSIVCDSCLYRVAFYMVKEYNVNEIISIKQNLKFKNVEELLKKKINILKDVPKYSDFKYWSKQANYARDYDKMDDNTIKAIQVLKECENNKKEIIEKMRLEDLLQEINLPIGAIPLFLK